jgi:hypothetical protein
MERVETLCNLLKEKIEKKASITELLNTVKMLESELIHLKNITPPADDAAKNKGASIVISKNHDQKTDEPEIAPAEEEKTVEVLQIDEAEVEAELEEIKKIAEDRNKISAHNKPLVTFDPVEDIPTLTHQQPYVNKPKEIHESLPGTETASLNDKLKNTQNELAETLQDAPVKDLKKAIGVNERYLYINELFRGDEAMYERSIKTINSFAIFPEAEYWIRRELKLKLGWSDQTTTVKQFDQLVRRRFS